MTLEESQSADIELTFRESVASVAMPQVECRKQVATSAKGAILCGAARRAEERLKTSNRADKLLLFDGLLPAEASLTTITSH